MEGDKSLEKTGDSIEKDRLELEVRLTEIDEEIEFIGKHFAIGENVVCEMDFPMTVRIGNMLEAALANSGKEELRKKAHDFFKEDTDIDESLEQYVKKLEQEKKDIEFKLK